MLSYWEKKHFVAQDLLVIGGGFVGLSTAIHFKRMHPKAGVMVLERGVFASGASTKNAGFACFGSLTEILDDLQQMSEAEVQGLVARRLQGLQAIQQEFGRAKLDYETCGGYELIQADQMSALKEIPRINSLLFPIVEKPVFTVVRSPRKFGFAKEVEAVVKNEHEGALDPGMYMMSLLRLAGALGIQVVTGATVSNLDISSGEVDVYNSWNETIRLKGSMVAVCTNAFSRNLLPDLDLEPGRGLVMVSERLPFTIPWKGTFHYDRGYVYFRKIDGRLLLGGGRNQDFEAEKSEDNQVNEGIASYLSDVANQLIFPGKDIKWEHKWTGIMAFGPKKSPIIEKIGGKVVAAVRMGGMGVAIGWQVGKELSMLLRKGF